MSRKLLTGNKAAAWAARLSEAEYIPAFPITPQTEIIETLSEWIGKGEMPGRMTMLESEHSMITAAGAAAATGARVFTATSSQGLLYGLEMLYCVSGWRVPMVLVNVSRGLGSPVTLEPDHNDVMAARDSGFLQLHCATCQEVLDAVLIATRLSEDPRVQIPVLVNLDGFYLSFTREPVDLPSPDDVRRFLPGRTRGPHAFRASAHQCQSVAALGGSLYSYFRYQLHLAAQGALEVFDEVTAEFETCFGRSHGPFESYRLEDAEYAFVMMGSFATKAKAAVDALRAANVKVGLLRPILLRPFPETAMREALHHLKAVAVIDQNISPGRGGVLHSEVASALYNLPDRPMLLPFIGGLGGRDIPARDFRAMSEAMVAAVEDGEVPPLRLLYTDDELREVRKMQAIAHGSRPHSHAGDA